MLDERFQDVYTLYMSGNPESVRRILEKYHVEYIVIGQIERLRYPDMDEDILKTMGDIVFESNELYMIMVT